MPRHVCLFDIDGTLISTLRAGVAAMDEAFLAEFGIHTPIDDAEISGRTDRAIARMQLTRHNFADSEENWQRVQNGYLRRLPAQLAERKGRVLPGIVPLLEELRSRADVAVGLLTGNVPGGAEIKLSHYGIYEHFAFGAFGERRLTRDEVAHDALEIVRREVAAELGPQQIIVIGDTPLDVACAKAIGARSVAVATGVHKVEQLRTTDPDVLVADLSDPGALLELLTL